MTLTASCTCDPSSMRRTCRTSWGRPHRHACRCRCCCRPQRSGRSALCPCSVPGLCRAHASAPRARPELACTGPAAHLTCDLLLDGDRREHAGRALQAGVWQDISPNAHGLTHHICSSHAAVACGLGCGGCGAGGGGGGDSDVYGGGEGCWAVTVTPKAYKGANRCGGGRVASPEVV